MLPSIKNTFIYHFTLYTPLEYKGPHGNCNLTYRTPFVTIALSLATFTRCGAPKANTSLTTTTELCFKNWNTLSLCHSRLFFSLASSSISPSRRVLGTLMASIAGSNCVALRTANFAASGNRKVCQIRQWSPVLPNHRSVSGLRHQSSAPFRSSGTDFVLFSLRFAFQSLLCPRVQFWWLFDARKCRCESAGRYSGGSGNRSTSEGGSASCSGDWSFQRYWPSNCTVVR